MFFKDLSQAIGSYGKAFGLFSKLGLWRFIFIPVLIGLLIGAGILALAYGLSDNIGDYLSSFWPWEFGSETVNSIGHFLGGVIVLVFGLIIFKHAVMALSAPFMAPISEKIEIHLTGRALDKTDTPKEYMRVLIRGIRINVRNLLLELLITIPLLLMSFIPILNLVSTALLIYVQSYYAGFGNMDYTLERHRDVSGSVKFVSKHKGVAVGNGLIFTLMLAIPFIGICLALPFSAAAATIDTVGKLESKALVKK
ncbi:MAG: EI24 domain-containing protein [Flavobacteriales bacterium]|nr:EI24 domain-containing protein [Flavobacteriales bacterium]